MKAHRFAVAATVAGLALAASLGLAGPAVAAPGKGLITIIVNDPSNPYWKSEADFASAEAEKLGYSTNVGAHKGDTNTESHLVDTAITNHSKAIILDPADADGSIGAVKKAVAAGIPVLTVNAEINQQGLAKAQLVSNNAQGAALAAQQFVQTVGSKGNFVELYGLPSDNNSQTRSNGFKVVLSQYPGLKKVAQQVANWDRSQGHDKMQGMLQAHPDIIGVLSGNDEMALGAIAALKEAGKLKNIKVGGFDGSPAAIDALKAGELQYTVMQPMAVFSKKAVQEADSFLRTGKTGAPREKQLFNCVLITQKNVDQVTGPFVLKQWQ